LHSASLPRATLDRSSQSAHSKANAVALSCHLSHLAAQFGKGPRTLASAAWGMRDEKRICLSQTHTMRGVDLRVKT
jgi:hypothetical protein